MFNCYNTSNLPIKLFIAKKAFAARTYIVLAPFKSNEIMLDKYLQEKYKLSLRSACLLIWKNCKFIAADNVSCYVIFQNKFIEELARVITYGDGKIHGSKILQKAFS